MNAKDDGATFMFSAICAPQNAPKVVATFREELDRALKEGFKADEIEKERKAWLDQQIVGRSQDGSLAATLLNRARFDRTMKFDADLEARIARLTLDEVNAAFRKHVDPAALSFAKGGDFKKAGVWQ